MRKLRPERGEWSPLCIGQLWGFEGLPREETLEVAKRALRRRYHVGQAVFRQVDTAREISLIKAERIRLSKVLEDGMELTLDIRKPSDFLGGIYLQRRLRLSGECLMHGRNPGVQFHEGQLRRIDPRTPPCRPSDHQKSEQPHLAFDRSVGAMSHSHLEERLYQVLLNVAKEHGQKKQEGYEIQFPLTHEDMGFLIGAHRVSITRVMKRLKASGRILQVGRKLVLPMEAMP